MYELQKMIYYDFIFYWLELVVAYFIFINALFILSQGTHNL